jgi:hypothetical protein
MQHLTEFFKDGARVFLGDFNIPILGDIPKKSEVY